ncbi:type VII secretion target [[Mycobacterium] wendilense]|uniref:Type VII secretion target n=1 Tax=[Mycobacterium] wendilense TaxID=3064284 RepID=A0ABM9M7V7_9MYCO|nr:type VII secretion target [Mycolicibacterium sp. MU0050]CAJ1578381.1 type VII secretion target [Mycolicibacterium sp. MU0050]
MQINVDLDNLRVAATQHARAAEQLRVVPENHHEIQQSLDSLGPIFADLREAGRELLEQRRACYEQQADDHVEMARYLEHAAAGWEAGEQDAVQQIRAVRDEQ